MSFGVQRVSKCDSIFNWSLTLCGLQTTRNKVIKFLRCIPIADHAVSDWSFASLFGRVVEKACPVAQSSRVIVELPQSGVYRVHPEPSDIQTGKAYYDLTKSECILFVFRLSSLILSSENQVWDIGTMWPGDFEYRRSNYCGSFPFLTVSFFSNIATKDRPRSILSTTQFIWINSG